MCSAVWESSCQCEDGLSVCALLSRTHTHTQISHMNANAIESDAANPSLTFAVPGFPSFLPSLSALSMCVIACLCCQIFRHRQPSTLHFNHLIIYIILLRCSSVNDDAHGWEYVGAHSRVGIFGYLYPLSGCLCADAQRHIWESRKDGVCLHSKWTSAEIIIVYN